MGTGRGPCCRCRCTGRGSCRGATINRRSWRGRWAKLTGLPVDPGLVSRKKRTRQQVGLSGDARQRNVAGAFAVHPDGLSRLKGRRVIIVDDVITTGSTVKAVTRALKAGGATAVDVISFARVVTGAGR